MTAFLDITPPTIDEDVADEECAACSDPFPADDALLFEGARYCDECVDHCEACEALVPCVVMEDDLCPGCNDAYRRCCECNDRQPVDDLTTVNSEDLCQACLDSDYTFCRRCDRYEPDNNRCAAVNPWIEDYSYKPTPQFHRVARECFDVRRPYFGVELETEAVTADIGDGAEVIRSGLGDLIYLKSDGSLAEGFEIVTHPMTLAFAQAQDWGALGELARLGFRSWQTTTCGLHVHVSRAGFKGKAHIWRFAHLFYRNAEAFQLLAGRSSCHWAKFDDQRSKVAQVLKDESAPDRQVAVNLCNTETVEVRMFRGSLKPARLLADVECVAAAVEYTRHLSVGEVKDGALGWGAFGDYVGTNAATYPHLVGLLANGGR